MWNNSARNCERKNECRLLEEYLRARAHTQTNSVDQGSYFEADNNSAAQETSRLAWYQKVLCRVHKGPRRDPILSQMNTIHIRTRYLFCIHFNIILPSTPMSPTWSIPFGFYNKISVRSSHSTYSCPFQAVWCDHPNKMWWRIQIMDSVILTLNGPTFCCCCHYYYYYYFNNLLECNNHNLVPCWLVSYSKLSILNRFKQQSFHLRFHESKTNQKNG
jgi:hypothetical protein